MFLTTGITLTTKIFHEKNLKFSQLFSNIKKLEKFLILATILTHIINFRMQKYFSSEVPCDLKPANQLLSKLL